MKPLLSEFVGSRVHAIHRSEDTVTIDFGEGDLIAILNLFEMGYDGALDDIEAQKPYLSNVKETDSSITLYFSNGASISVGLKPSDFIGPEAIDARWKGEIIIVLEDDYI